MVRPYTPVGPGICKPAHAGLEGLRAHLFVSRAFVVSVGILSSPRVTEGVVAGHDKYSVRSPVGLAPDGFCSSPEGAQALPQGASVRPRSVERRRTVVANAQEKEAIVQFLENMRDERAMRKRLFELTSEKPEKVMIYLDSLPEGVEQQDELMQRLRVIATAALQGRIQLIE